MIDLLPGIESLKWLKLKDNKINLPWPVEFQTFVDNRCFDRASPCTGLPYVPPFTCSAFTEWARPKMNNPSECDPCDGDKTPTIILVIATAVIICVVLLVYVVIILKFPEALRRWVSFAIILVNHTDARNLGGVWTSSGLLQYERS